MMFPKSATTMLLSASFMAAPALAQQAQPVQPGQPARPGVQVQVNPNGTAGARVATGQTASAPINEHTLAACVAIANQEEVAIAKMAADKAKHKEVKEFAKMLAEDHQGFLKKLQRFAPEAQETLQAASGQSNQSRVQTAGATAGQPQAQAQPGQAIQQVAGQAQTAPIDVIQLHREVAQQCLADAKKKMGEMEGEKFDFCFMGHQIAKHEEMKTKLTVFQRHASGEFAQLLATGLETTETHLKKAEEIMKDLDKDHHEKNEKSEKRDKSDK